jgi:hypothetical protein
VTRLSLALAVACGALIALAPSAAAATCELGAADDFQSCLSIRHSTRADGQVQLVRSTAVLLVRLDACPARVARRAVTLRRSNGARLARVTARGTCKRDGDEAIARWRAVSRRKRVLDPGTAVRSDWADVDEGRDFAEVEVGEPRE